MGQLEASGVFFRPELRAGLKNSNVQLHACFFKASVDWIHTVFFLFFFTLFTHYALWKPASALACCRHWSLFRFYALIELNLKSKHWDIFIFWQHFFIGSAPPCVASGALFISKHNLLHQVTRGSGATWLHTFSALLNREPTTWKFRVSIFFFPFFWVVWDFFLDCVFFVSTGSHHPPTVPARRHREMKLGFVLQTAVALYLLLSPAQVRSYNQRNFMFSMRLFQFILKKKMSQHSEIFTPLWDYLAPLLKTTKCKNSATDRW